MIESVQVHDQYPDVIVVTDQNLARMHYLLRDGVLYPGRCWVTTGQGHHVAFFLPFPDGMPTLLEVKGCPRVSEPAP